MHSYSLSLLSTVMALAPGARAVPSSAGATSSALVHVALAGAPSCDNAAIDIDVKRTFDSSASRPLAVIDGLARTGEPGSCPAIEPHDSRAGAVSADDRSPAGTYLRSVVVEHHPLGEHLVFQSSMTIKQITPSRAFVEIEISEPTAGSSCHGQIAGAATVHGKVLVLTPDNLDESEPVKNRCQLTIHVANGIASVVGERGSCRAYSGAACDFREEAARLKKR